MCYSKIYIKICCCWNLRCTELIESNWTWVFWNQEEIIVIKSYFSQVMIPWFGHSKSIFEEFRDSLKRPENESLIPMMDCPCRPKDVTRAFFQFGARIVHADFLADNETNWILKCIVYYDSSLFIFQHSIASNRLVIANSLVKLQFPRLVVV